MHNGSMKKLTTEQRVRVIALDLHTCIYNWTRKHTTLKGQTPAMAAGLTDRVWSIGDIVELLEAAERGDIEAGGMKRGPYKKKVK